MQFREVIGFLLVIFISSEAFKTHAKHAALADDTGNPIRKVVAMMEKMAKKIEEEGKSEEDLFEKFECYCKKTTAELEESISIAVSSPMTQADIDSRKAEVDSLEAEVKKLWFKSLMATSIFFALAILLESLVIGPARYWNRMQYRHRFDVLSIALLMTTQLSAVAYSGRAPDCLVRTVLVMHISRGICLMQYIAAFRYLLALLGRLLPVYYRLGLLLLMVFYIFATIGEQIFGGRMQPEALKGSGYAAAQYWPLNFDDFPSGLVTLFCIMVINNWFVLAAGFMEVTTPYAAAFFVLFFVIVNLIVLNILIALIIDTSAVVREEIVEDEQVDEEAEDLDDAEEEKAFYQEGREALLQRLLLNEEHRSTSFNLNVLSKGSVPLQKVVESDSYTTSDSTSDSSLRA